MGRIIIYNYTDYRKYMHDYFENEKINNPSFSHRYFMMKAGYKSHGLYSGIVQGKNNLSLRLAPKFAQAMKLTEQETKYFILMIQCSTAKSDDCKEKLQHTLHQYHASQKTQLRKYQKKYYQNWHTVAIREALCILNVSDNYDELAQFLEPAISIDEARNSIKVLSELNLIERNTEGHWKACDPQITATGDIGKEVLQSFQARMIQQGEKAIKTFTKDERYINSLTFGLSHEKYLSVIDYIQKIRDEVSDSAIADINEERVYQLNIQLFPLTKKKPGTELK